MCSERTSTTRPSGARWSSVGRISASHWRSVAAKTSPSRFDAVSSGPKIRNVSGPRASAAQRRDLVESVVEFGGEVAVNGSGVVAGDDERTPAAPFEERHELVLRDPREHGRIRDLVPVQMEDREHDAVALRTEELVSVPARRER